MVSGTVAQRVSTAGKYFRLGDAKWRVRGLTYGPFAPDADGQFLPPRDRVRRDLAHIRSLGGNAIRLYHVPPVWLLDEALAADVRVMIDVPWQKHRCFFEDWSAVEEARLRVAAVARELGNHPGVFALSVANELPADIVRYYGTRRVERFLSDLLDIAKTEAPDCLTCFGNFPTTEFLQPDGGDFLCFNVYLHDPEVLRGYLDRLQHLAGNRPLVLGEYGTDTLRHGEMAQADQLEAHVREVYRCGLGGSFVFAYTDDWYTGGCQIDDWAFGVTRSDRTEKRSARRLRNAWSEMATSHPDENLPRISVVVCSYNGAATLEECLRSLMRLNYPDYEVILVDDGSTDRTPAIAAEFPQVIYISQPNRGLSASRNVGAEAAIGEIVAYTDSDCVVDEDWLLYIARGMRDQQVQMIGGPNVTPLTDCAIAHCVAASPGNPSHVMFDDRRAEHLPGCNLAVKRDVLLALGGFDSLFRTAGDDVDLCWRFLDAGMEIGFAPGAMVWHHRRATIRAYLKQQKGYGRAEGMVQFKHPERFDGRGCSRWKGVIYGEGAVGLPVVAPRIYHGYFGFAPFQAIYRTNDYSQRFWLRSFEWHATALFVAMLAWLYWPLLLVSLSMWALAVAETIHCARRAPLPRSAPWWSRPLVAGFYLVQPLVRAVHRLGWRMTRKGWISPPPNNPRPAPSVEGIGRTASHVNWHCENGRGREQALDLLPSAAQEAGWVGEFRSPWSPCDMCLIADVWHDVAIHTATEDLGWPRRFTRVRWSVRPSRLCRSLAVVLLLWAGVAIAADSILGQAIGLSALSAMLTIVMISRRRCNARAVELLLQVGEDVLRAGADHESAATVNPREETAVLI